MKKRLMCALLTLVMLVSLVPMGASAAGKSISESAITVLKQLETYKSVCTQHGTEYRIGYGTICDRKGPHSAHTDTYTEKKADKALRAKLSELDTAVNAFSTKTGKTLSQGQHDALVVFSYDVGTSWMNGTGVMRSAVVNGLEGNEFINTMCGFFPTTDDDTRRRVEANMYLDGEYSASRPTNYAWVDFDTQGGTMVENTRYYYDYSDSVSLTQVPVRPGYIFMGWYNDNLNWITTLNRDTSRITLYAHWQKNGATTGTKVNYKMNINQFTSRQPLAAADEDAEDLGDKIDRGTVVQIAEDFIDKDGNKWCRVAKGGWLQLGVPDDDTDTAEIDVIVTVTNDYVRSRRNAAIDSTQNGTYHKGDKLRIINTDSNDGFLWGQVANDEYEPIGWVALMYTNWNEVKDSGNTAPTKAIATAVVNCAGYLNVRAEADDESAIVGALADGDTVNIYEIEFVNGHQWGNTGNGWILLSYAKVTMLTNDLDYTTSADVLAYTFTGTLKSAVAPKVDAYSNADKAGSTLKKDTLVAISMLKDNGGEIWGYNGTGWISLSNIKMDTAKYVVVSDSVTVRENPGSSSKAQEKVVKGVELNITDLKIVDATIWGKTEKYGGWVNLASKYVQRTNAPIIEKDDADIFSGMIATVINTDSVRVRETHSTSAKILDTLSGGTTVAVWEIDEDEEWYKIDTNQNGKYDYDGDGWVFGKYLDVRKGSVGGSSESGSTSTAVETGLGIVANTYTGVNVRTGAGTGNAQVGKILTGTTVEILEVKSVGAAKWGRVTQGWICMDYVTMIKNYPIAGSTPAPETNSNAGTNAGGSTTTTEGSTTISSTPAVYTGVTLNEVQVQKTADTDALSIRTLAPGSKITIQELRKVSTKIIVSTGSVVDGNTTTETNTYSTVITYWARVNDGWIVDPESNLELDALDETIYTATGASEVRVCDSVNGSKVNSLDKGAQVAITSLEISGDKVWGYAEDITGGWINLEEMSEGAIDTTPVETQPEAPSDQLILGSTGNTANNGTNGFVNNAGGYRYTGNVIRTNSLNVRATASQTAAQTTTLKGGDALVIYETVTNEGMAWGRCDAGWVYLYYVDLQPCNNAVDAKVVYNENTIAYTDANCTSVAGTYSRMSVVDIYEVVGSMARTDLGWVHTDNLG